MRGRTVTCALLVLAAVYHLSKTGDKGGKHAAGGHRPPSEQRPGLEDDVEQSDGDDDDDEDEEWLSHMNSTELRERLKRRAARRVRLNPMQWRQNRKKITELTDITSVKRSEAAAADGASVDEAISDVEGGADNGESAPSQQSTMQWLSEQWSAGAAAPSKGRPARKEGPANGGPDGGWRLTSDAARAERRKRWMEHGSERLCRQLQKAHGVRPTVTWGTLPQRQRRAWVTLKCDEVVASDGRAALTVRGNAALPTPTAGRSTGSDGGEGALSSEEECAEMSEAHGVSAGSTWGSLPEALKLRWKQLGCDQMKQELLRRPMRNRRAVARAAAAAVDGLPRARLGTPYPAVRATASAPYTSSNQCLDMQIAHGVKVGIDWGTLSVADRRRWTNLGCDRRVN